MKIAVLNPYSGPVAEVESCQWLFLAARNLGHEAIICHDERDILRCSPDLVLNLSFQNPKLTRFPTYGLLNLPTSILSSAPRFTRNCLTYDAVFSLSPGVAEWYADFCFGVRKPANVYLLAVTTHAISLAGEIDFTAASIGYAGTNWDGLRLQGVFENLAATGDISLYGPPEKWRHVDQRAVKGLVPFDGESLLRVYRKHGIGLALAHPEFVAEQIPHNRIFEVAAAGALVICSDYRLVRDWFGDSFLYVDQSRDPQRVAEDILTHLHWARRNPESAAAKAKAAHAIFREKFAMDKLLAGALTYHQDLLVKKRYVAGEAAHEPRISVILRAGMGTSEAIGRALDSLAAQTCSNIAVLLVIDQRPDGFEALLARHNHDLKITVIDCPGGNRSRALWAGLHCVDADYFAMMESCDEYYPNHFALLLDRIAHSRRLKSRPVKFVFSGSVAQCVDKVLYENTQWQDNPMFSGPHYLCIRSFAAAGSRLPSELLAGRSVLPRSWLASTDLLDAEILSDPNLDDGEELYLQLLLLEKENFTFNYEVTACVHVSGEEPSRAEARLTPELWDKIQRRLCGRSFRVAREMQGVFPFEAGELSAAAPLHQDTAASPGPRDVAEPRSLGQRFRGLWGAFRHGLPPDFDGATYLRLNPDVAAANANPAEHFLAHGAREGRRWR